MHSPFGHTLAGKVLMIVLCLALVSVLGGCFRGKPSDKPPIHLNPNMDNQPKYLPQATSAFFEDGSAMRPLVDGTVSREGLQEDDAYYLGMDASGKPLKVMPVPMTKQLLLRGQKEYDIYCAPCHSRIGDGRGIMVDYQYVPPPSFHDTRLLAVEDGHIFDVITNGLRNMPSYRHQIPAADRWAIVAYVRALQRSQNATQNDIPEALRDRVK